MTGSDVVVNKNGRLGVVLSSARFKHDIRDMGDSSAALMKLRPVTFRYKNDEANERQYGLVAEEVARVYPELVTQGADGKIESVGYSMLAGMLLNELQKQAHEMRTRNQEARIRAAENARQAEQLKKLSARLSEMQARHERELEAMRTSFEARLSALEQTTQARNGDHKLVAALDR